MALAAPAIGFRMNVPGVAARGVSWGAVIAGVLIAGLIDSNTAAYATTAAIYVLVGLSLNVILGYTGQMSLGHQGLMGSGALFAAYLSTAQNLPFAMCLVVAAVAGAAFALIIGLVALRIRGLYLALVTLVVGITLQTSLFEVPALTGGGAGEPANRPNLLLANDRYYFVCVAVVIAAWYLDSRLTGSKAGRALLTIKEDERVAAAFGINVVGYKLLAFVLSGALAGVAGGLFAFSSEQFNGNDFSFLLALTFVLMTVVGGAGSRTGVVAGSALFAVLQTFLANFYWFKQFCNLFPGQLANNLLQFGPNLIAALLLLITLAVNPRGMAQQLEPIVTWMRGGPFRPADRSHAIKEGISGRP
jgi:branched-chain amino acid transport system permease protein